jgi:hypothetical protein
MLAYLAAAAMLNPADNWKQRGLEVVEQIRREYYLPDSKLYCESIDGNGQKSGPAFNWGVGVMLSALNAAAKLDPKYKPWLREYSDASRVYWNDKGPVPGYDVLPGPKSVDRYYDDNAWMVLALVETYEILKDKKYLDWAEQTLNFVLSGWDEKLGGGIYWREKEKTSKNACSNAPSAAACMAVAKYRRGYELTAFAEKIMFWTQKNLQDPADRLIWDNINMSGKVDRTKWTYNTGLYIRGWAMLARNIGVDQLDLNDVFKSSVARWFDKKTGAAKDGGRFAHLWFEGLVEAQSKDRDARKEMRKALEYVYTNVRNSQGRYANGWNAPIKPSQSKFELIDQASVARAYLFIALQQSGR